MATYEIGNKQQIAGKANESLSPRARLERSTEENLATIFRKNQETLFPGQSDIFIQQEGENKGDPKPIEDIIQIGIDLLLNRTDNTVPLRHDYAAPINNQMSFIEALCKQIGIEQDAYDTAHTNALKQTPHAQKSREQKALFDSHGLDNTLLHALRQDTGNKEKFLKTQAGQDIKAQLEKTNGSFDAIWAMEQSRRATSIIPLDTSNLPANQGSFLDALKRAASANDTAPLKGRALQELKTLDEIFTKQHYKQLEDIPSPNNKTAATAYANMREVYAAQAYDAFMQRAAAHGIPENEIGAAIFDSKIGIGRQDLELVRDHIRIQTINTLAELKGGDAAGSPRANSALRQLEKLSDNNDGKPLTDAQIKSVVGDNFNGDIHLVNAALKMAPIYETKTLENGLTPLEGFYTNSTYFGTAEGRGMFAHAESAAINRMWGELDDAHIDDLKTRLNTSDTEGLRQRYSYVSFGNIKGTTNNFVERQDLAYAKYLEAKYLAPIKTPEQETKATPNSPQQKQFAAIAPPQNKTGNPLEMAKEEITGQAARGVAAPTPNTENTLDLSGQSLGT